MGVTPCTSTAATSRSGLRQLLPSKALMTGMGRSFRLLECKHLCEHTHTPIRCDASTRSRDAKEKIRETCCCYAHAGLPPPSQLAVLLVSMLRVLLLHARSAAHPNSAAEPLLLPNIQIAPPFGVCEQLLQEGREEEANLRRRRDACNEVLEAEPAVSLGLDPDDPPDSRSSRTHHGLPSAKQQL